MSTATSDAGFPYTVGDAVFVCDGDPGRWPSLGRAEPEALRGAGTYVPLAGRTRWLARMAPAVG